MKLRKRLLTFIFAGILLLSLVVTTMASDEIPEATHPFTDVAAYGWATESLNKMYEKGIINGTSATTFDPEGKFTREMMVTMFWRLERIHAAHLMAKLPEKPKPVSTDKNDPNPDKIGYASYGDLVLADGFSLSKTLLVTDGNSKNQFTATTFGNRGWHETRIVRNEYGTYVVFAQDEALDKEGTYSGQYTYATVKTKFYLVKVSDNGFKKVLEGYYPSSWSGSAQVNVLCGNDGLRWLNLQLT